MYYDGLGDYGDYVTYASTGDNLFATIMIIYLLIIGVALIGAVVDYLLRGFGMYKIGKAEGRTNSWLAFIPFGRTYFQGELCGEIKFKNKSLKNPGIWLIVVPMVANVAFGVVYFIFIMITMLSTVGSISTGYYVGSFDQTVAGAVSGLIVFIIFTVLFLIVYQALIQTLYMLVNRQIYAKYTDPNMATVHAVCGMWIPFYQSACMFIFGRRAEDNMKQKQIQYEEPNSME